MRVVIDTNCLIASIPAKNPEYWLYLAFRQKAFDWHISNEILLEYEETLTNFYSPLTAELVINILLTASNVIRSEAFIRWNLITKDSDDNKFANLAVSANVNYLITNDHHFDIFKKNSFPQVNILSLIEFQKVLGY